MECLTWNCYNRCRHRTRQTCLQLRSRTERELPSPASMQTTLQAPTDPASLSMKQPSENHFWGFYGHAHMATRSKWKLSGAEHLANTQKCTQRVGDIRKWRNAQAVVGANLVGTVRLCRCQETAFVVGDVHSLSLEVAP